MTSNVFFSKPDLLFPQEPIKQDPDLAAQWYKDAYRGNDPTTPAPSELPPGVLPNIIVSEDGNAQKNFSPNEAKSKNVDPNDNFDIAKDSVFDQPLTNDPEVVDRAAQALIRDTERMLLYMALMQYDSEHSRNVDEKTGAALQSALSAQTGAMQERMKTRLQSLSIGDSVQKRVMDFFQAINEGINAPSKNISASSAAEKQNTQFQ